MLGVAFLKWYAKMYTWSETNDQQKNIHFSTGQTTRKNNPMITNFCKFIAVAIVAVIVISFICGFVTVNGNGVTWDGLRSVLMAVR